jgi:uncharacterized membrane protein (DUF2068 family)
LTQAKALDTLFPLLDRLNRLQMNDTTALDWTLRVLEELLSDGKSLLQRSFSVVTNPCPTEPSKSLVPQGAATVLSNVLINQTRATEPSEEALLSAAELLEAVALESSLARREIFTGPLASLLDYVETGTAKTAAIDEKELEKAKAATARAVMATAGEDEVMEAVFAADGRGRWLVDRLKAWLGLIGSRIDLAITASIMLANLARKGTSCKSRCRLYRVTQPGPCR